MQVCGYFGIGTTGLERPSVVFAVFIPLKTCFKLSFMKLRPFFQEATKRLQVFRGIGFKMSGSHFPAIRPDGHRSQIWP